MKIPPVFIIAGKQGEGKTTKLQEVVDGLEKNKFELCGFVAPGEWSTNKRVGFSIKDINSGTTKILCQDEPKVGFQKIGRFYFNTETIEFGEKILTTGEKSKRKISVIDEVGLFEMEGKVWAKSLKSLIKTRVGPLLITVRNKFVEDIIDRFKMENAHVFTLKSSTSTLVDKIIDQLKVDS